MQYKIIISFYQSNKITEAMLEFMNNQKVKHITLPNTSGECSFILPETSDYKVWLTEERKKAYQDKMNKSAKDLLDYQNYFVIDEIKVEVIN